MEASEVRTYTLGRPPEKTGLGNLPIKVNILIAVTFLSVMVSFVVFGPIVAAGVLLIGGVVIALVQIKPHGRSAAAIWQLSRQAGKSARRGERLYVSGPDSKVPGGRFSPAGPLARLELIESTDSAGNPYAIAVDRPNNRATVFLDCQLTGDVDRTMEERDQNTADYGRFMAGLSLSGDVVSDVTVISHRPATGQLAEQEVTAQLDQDAPELARRIQAEAAAELECHKAITFAIDRTEKLDDSFIENLDYLIPNIYPELAWAGIIAAPMDYEAVVSRVRSFYDPSTEPLFEGLRVEGRRHGLRWEDAGPGFADAGVEMYCHENCRSVTWEMVEAPASTFEDRVLRALAQPNVNIPRGRLALIYHPISSERGSRIVEDEHKSALVGMNSSKSITKTSSAIRAEETDQARREVGRGAQMGLYSLMFTATLGPDDDLRRVSSAVKQAASQSSIRMEPYKSMHDVGFVLTAGLGHTSTSLNTVTRILR
ncbi:SCO6880 family protein [Corynebacterium bovis]|uniref:SCO6880 family protein n=1 Tax=Corynebacterium bovis TaxID=36808 RepID=UPI003138879C